MKPTDAEIVDVAQCAFWDAVVDMLPEVKTGDFPPDAQFAFDEACRKAVTLWREINKPEPGALLSQTVARAQDLLERCRDGEPVTQRDFETVIDFCRRALRQ